MKNTSNKVSVDISKEIIDNIKLLISDSGGAFQTVEEFIEYVLNELLKDAEPQLEHHNYSEDDEERIKERLRKLGYIE